MEALGNDAMGKENEAGEMRGRGRQGRNVCGNVEMMKWKKAQSVTELELGGGDMREKEIKEGQRVGDAERGRK